MPFAPGGEELVSPSGELAFTVLTVPNDFNKAADWGTDVRAAVSDSGGGLAVYVTGNLGLFADFVEVFEGIDTSLLLATVVLVFTLLLIIYRSIVMPFIPIVVVGIAYAIALGFVYL